MGETTNILIISLVTGITLILIILMVYSYCKKKNASKNLVYTRVTFDSDSEENQEANIVGSRESKLRDAAVLDSGATVHFTDSLDDITRAHRPQTRENVYLLDHFYFYKLWKTIVLRVYLKQ